MKCGTKKCQDYNENLIDHCEIGQECTDYTSWKTTKIIELETIMQEFVDWMNEKKIVTSEEMELWMIASALKFKQLLKN